MEKTSGGAIALVCFLWPLMISQCAVIKTKQVPFFLDIATSNKITNVSSARSGAFPKDCPVAQSFWKGEWKMEPSSSQVVVLTMNRTRFNSLVNPTLCVSPVDCFNFSKFMIDNNQIVVPVLIVSTESARNYTLRLDNCTSYRFSITLDTPASSSNGIQEFWFGRGIAIVSAGVALLVVFMTVATACCKSKASHKQNKELRGIIKAQIKTLEYMANLIGKEHTNGDITQHINKQVQGMAEVSQPQQQQSSGHSRLSSLPSYPPPAPPSPPVKAITTQLQDARQTRAASAEPSYDDCLPDTKRERPPFPPPKKGRTFAAYDTVAPDPQPSRASNFARSIKSLVRPWNRPTQTPNYTNMGQPSFQIVREASPSSTLDSHGWAR